MPNLRLLIADDQPVVLSGLRSLLRAAPDIEVVGAVRDAFDVVALAERSRPDIVLLDIAMQAMAGVEALNTIHRELPRTRVVVFSSIRSPEWVHESLELGAAGYIVKDQDLEDLIAILHAIHAGETYLSPNLLNAAAKESPPARGKRSSVRPLTQRERQILDLLVQEKSSRQIAALLAISPRTVTTHRANIMRKLDTHTTTGLVRYALRAEQDRG
jgi:DNA-binding NarL/FixJ family response regulator